MLQLEKHKGDLEHPRMHAGYCRAAPQPLGRPAGAGLGDAQPAGGRNRTILCCRPCKRRLLVKAMIVQLYVGTIFTAGLAKAQRKVLRCSTINMQANPVTCCGAQDGLDWSAPTFYEVRGRSVGLPSGEFSALHSPLSHSLLPSAAS